MLELLQKAVAMGGSDIFIVPGASVTVKVNNVLKNLTDNKLLPADTEAFIKQIWPIGTFICWMKKGTTISPSLS